MAPDPVAGESEAVPVGNTSMAGPTDWKNRPNAGFNRIFTAILILWVIILVAYFFVLPAIGLLTGSLYLPGRGGGRTIHGIWARILSATILTIAAFVVWKARKKSKRPAARAR